MAGPPPYVEPPFDEEEFAPRLKLERRRISGFETLSHAERMRLVDEANEIFRFAYTRGMDANSGALKGYYKIPITRGRNVEEYYDIDKTVLRIGCAEYERAMAILDSVGGMERIVRAIPYYGLYQAVTEHLRRDHKVGTEQTVLVSVDRGGRLPCIILMRALGLAEMHSLKVDQGGGQLDENRLAEFAQSGIFRDNHVLFVDSTVDSGRQINVLERYFDSDAWRGRLGHKSWSVVGSNECGLNLKHHLNVNWGVNPDITFEDKPEIMGIDYAPGTHTKVVDCPTEASEAIRECLLAIPDGYVYAAADIDQQIEAQRKKWSERQKARRAEHDMLVAGERAEYEEQNRQAQAEAAVQRRREKIERKFEQITSSRRWNRLVAECSSLPQEALPSSLPNGTSHAHCNVLVVGSGKKTDLPQSAVQFVAENLGPYCSFFAGTPKGNPGAVLQATLASAKVAQPEVRLYQPGHLQCNPDSSYGGVPVVFAGEKDDMRRQMIADSHAVLTLGGAEGTLREVLLALDAGKPTILIEGYGPVPAYILSNRRLCQKSNLKSCKNLVEAVQTILDMSRM